MKILHTADWHLGVSAEQAPRDEEHRRFLEWLIETLEAEQVEVLIHAGDVFHHMQPSARSQRMYYEFLARCASLEHLRQIVITGGNHDSPSRLEAPRDVLRAIQVHVVGTLWGDEASWSRCLCPVIGASGAVEVVIAAAPYVHESRLGVVTAEVEPEAIRASLVQRFTALYRTLADEAQTLWPGVPLLGMGHLTCFPHNVQDRLALAYHTPIHLIEVLGGLPPSIFDPRFAYVALGHLHQMFPIPEANAWYAGSPVPTDLLEARRARYVLLLETDPAQPDAKLTPRPVEVPCWRAIQELRGPQDLVLEDLAALTWASPLTPYLYVEVESPEPLHGGLDRLEETLERFERGQRPRIVRYRETLIGDTPWDDPDAEVAPAPTLADLTPLSVFERLFRLRHEVEPSEEVRAAFASLVVELEPSE